jgi:hypothetical protein
MFLYQEIFFVFATPDTRGCVMQDNFAGHQLHVHRVNSGPLRRLNVHRADSGPLRLRTDDDPQV